MRRALLKADREIVMRRKVEAANRSEVLHVIMDRRDQDKTRNTVLKCSLTSRNVKEDEIFNDR